MALGSVGIQDYIRSILGSGQLPVETQEGRGDMDTEGNILGIDEEDVLERLGPRVDIQDFIMQQFAGDVVPMRTHPVQTIDAMQRLQTPGVQRRSQGQKSIEEFSGGSKRNPMLDLMDVIMFPGGQKVY